MNAPIDVVLERALQLVANHATWHQGAFAIDAFGWPCQPTDPHACRWCASGAVAKIAGGYARGLEAIAALDQEALRLYGRSTVGVNDGLGHASTLRLFHHAIRRVRAGASS